MTKIRPRALALCAAFTILIGLLIFWKIDRTPGLNADEAWTGLRAMDIQRDGLTSPHGMNWYTAPMHAAMVAKTFDILGTGTWQLRLPGAAINVIAAGIMALFIAAVFGETAMLVFGGLLLVSPFYFLEARIAWEVCALQNFLAAVMLWSAWRLFSDETPSTIALIAFIYAAAVGALNHLIFMALPIGFAAGFCAKALRGDRRARFLAEAAAWATLCAGLLLLTKKHTSDTFWQAHRVFFTSLFIFAPVISAALCLSTRKLTGRLWDALTPALARAGGKTGSFLIYTGLAAFIWFHATAFMGILSGFNMFKRFFSLDLGFAGAVPMFLWAAVIMGAVLSGALAAFRSEDAEDRKLFAGCLMLGVTASFTMLRNTNSARYYIVPFLVFALAAAVFLPDYLRGMKRNGKIFMALCALLPVFFSVREMQWPVQRRPFHFTQGWHDETSARMMDASIMAEKARAEKTCVFAGDNFLVFPTEFHYRSRKWECVPARRMVMEYCYDCADPPYIRHHVE